MAEQSDGRSAGADSKVTQGATSFRWDGDLDERRRRAREELAIGLDVDPPKILVIDEPTPNTISGQSGSAITPCVTTGVLSLPRREIEALCAHA